MAPQDSFIDDDEDTCPLCVEEFDLSDKNFRPCPCGYQICQFCYNNIKNNINGLCPACRRPYDEKSIEWKVVTPEEIAQFKANVQKNAKKKQEQRQKEAQKREVETLNRKHLSGLRVVQKNLVYVVGLSPGIPDQDLLSTLRGEKYFGQYGKIIKIVVSSKKPTDGGPNGQSLGVYVTFARKEDAARCIAAVNGSQNGDRVLRAQLGTTKYCSAYLRNEHCSNKSCMFLHEPGDNDDSYSRQDLSSINSVNTQRPLSSAASSSRQGSQTHVPIQHPQPVAAATQPMAREDSKEGSEGDGSALPSSASWANRGLPQRSRRGSIATSGTTSSPAVSQIMPVTTEVVEEPPEETPEPPRELPQESPQEAPQEPTPEVENTVSTSSTTDSVTPLRPERDPVLMHLLKAINSPVLSFPGPVTPNDNTNLPYPPMFDDRGGEKRRAMREQQEEARLHLDQDSQEDLQSVTEPPEEEEPESGSLQLGGEPEDRDHGRDGMSQSFQRRPSTQLPIQRASNSGPFGPSLTQGFPQNMGNLSSINGRTLTPLQQQQLLLLKSQPQSSFLEQYPPGMSSQAAQGSSLFQQQGHNRQSSRYTFANDSSSASASIKLSANPKLMAQQSSMMPSGNHAQQGSQFYASSMGPPPGLKSSGTPPIGGMFGQGHGFGGSMGGFGGIQKENNSDLLRDMLRGRGAVGGGQSHDAGKQDQMLPSLDDTNFVDALVADSTVEDYSTREFNSFGQASRSSTPSVPPGFGLPHSHPPPALREEIIAKSASRIVPTSAPFTPRKILQAVPNPLTHVPVALPSIQNPLSSSSESSTSQAKQEVKVLATNTGLSKAIASQASHPTLQSEDFPALDSGKGKVTLAPATPKLTSVPTPIVVSKKPTTFATVQSTQASNGGAEKRSTPILNISVPTKPPTKSTTSAEKQASGTSAFPPLPSSTTSSIQSPLSRNIPKTLRLTSTPKTEVPPAGVATPSSVTSTIPPHFPTFRQLSLTSTAKLDRPGTPTSEIISDNASVTSASMSRASSPPPSKIGSAPVRTTTKSSQKKLRQVQKEKDRAEIEIAAKVEPEVEIAPIMGRKKKQKKERTIHSAAGGSTPAVSRPPSPGPAASIVEESKAKLVPADEKIESNEQPKNEQESNKYSGKGAEPKSKGKGKALQRPPTPEPPSATMEIEDEVVDKPLPTPASVLQDLVSSGIIADLNELQFLKAPSSTYRHLETPVDTQSVNQKLTITPEDRAALLAGKPVHKIADGPHRIMLTPNGDCVRNLSPEEEQRYLQYQARLAEEVGPSAFVSSKHSGSNGFTLIGGRAVPNGPPSFFPSANKGTTALDPVGKIQRDEALNYINQYVLPSLSSNTQLEKALNANALEGEMLRSSEATAWTSWGMDPAPAHTEGGDLYINGTINREGMIATGLENMTAHFAIGGDIGRGQPLGNVTLLSLPDAESAIQVARKEAEGLEKRLNALIKKNRRLLLGANH